MSIYDSNIQNNGSAVNNVISMEGQLKQEINEINALLNMVSNVIDTSSNTKEVELAKKQNKELIDKKRETIATLKNHQGEMEKINEIGGVPANVEEYVINFLSKYNITLRCKNVVKSDHPTAKDYKLLRTALLHIKNKLALPYQDSAVTTALSYIDDLYTAEYIDGIKQLVVYNQKLDGVADAKLDRLEELMFTVPKAGLLRAVIKRFIWQVKVKTLLGQDITFKCRPIMPIIYGAEQSIGKTKLVEKICSPFHELTVQTSFSKMCEEKSMGNWTKAIAHFPEMAKADKESTDIIKNAITQYRMNFRLSHTNDNVNINNMTTFIGDTNRPIDVLIKDTSGLSRFVQLNINGDLQRFSDEVKSIHAFINSINWLEVWQSVDENGDDPLTGYIDLVTDDQNNLRVESCVEQWLNDEERDLHRKELDSGTEWKKSKHYQMLFIENYIPWCEANAPRMFVGGSADFLREMKSFDPKKVRMMKPKNKYHFAPLV